MLQLNELNTYIKKIHLELSEKTYPSSLLETIENSSLQNRTTIVKQNTKLPVNRYFSTVPYQP